MQTAFEIIPENLVGKPVDIQYSKTGTKAAEAIYRYQCAAEKLLSPHRWHELAGFASAEFVIMEKGEVLKNARPLQEGDIVRIDVPGPGAVNGSGYDWVKVESLKRNLLSGYTQSLVLILQPTSNPMAEDTAVAHFFSEKSRSVFVLTRFGYKVDVSYHGRNEVPDIADVNWLDKIRNGLVAAGALAGWSELQWSRLTKAFLNIDAACEREQSTFENNI